MAERVPLAAGSAERLLDEIDRLLVEFSATQLELSAELHAVSGRVAELLELRASLARALPAADDARAPDSGTARGFRR
jgi:hypothetical protein